MSLFTAFVKNKINIYKNKNAKNKHKPILKNHGKQRTENCNHTACFIEQHNRNIILS